MNGIVSVPKLPLASRDEGEGPFIRSLSAARAQAFFEYGAKYPMFAHLGMALDHIETDRAVISVGHIVQLEGPGGALHGGILATAIDTSIGFAMASTMVEGYMVATVSLDVKYYRPAMSGRFKADGRILRKGRIVHGEVKMTDEAGRDVAQGYCVYMPIKAGGA
ncbi:MAG: PaaI family thioesterase [Alphaproteobacteria bacterium]